MAKARTVFFCQSCGAQSAKWIGHCPVCGEWNTYVEEVIQKETVATTTGQWKPASTVPGGNTKKAAKSVPLGDILAEDEPRILTPDGELNRVLGGGIVPGSIILIGGEPGIGKSTLMLQIALSLRQMKVLYVSGEESEAQIKMRPSAWPTASTLAATFSPKPTPRTSSGRLTKCSPTSSSSTPSKPCTPRWWKAARAA